MKRAVRWTRLCVAGCLGFSAATVHAAPPGKPGRGVGGKRPPVHAASAVQYATASRAYLAVGTEEGLEPGAALVLRRGTQSLGECKVDHVTAHAASCVMKGRAPKVGDAFELPRFRSGAAPRPKPLPPVYTPRQLEAQRAALDGAELARVDFQPTEHPAPLSRLAAEVNLTETAWVSASNAQGGFQQQRLDLMVRGAELGAGFEAYLDMTVLHWSQRGAGSRFPLQASTDVFVREAAVASRDASRPWTLAVGRLLPWHTPGIGTVDGLQAGWRNGSGSVEAGLLAGALPDMVSTAPGTSRSLVAGYVSGFFADVGALRWMQTEAVVSAQQIPSQGWHLAVDGLWLASVGRVADVAGEVRLGTGATTGGLLEAARVDLSVRPDPKLRLSGGVRYLFDALGEVLEPGATTAVDHSLHASGSVSYELARVTLGGNVGYARDYVTGLTRGFLGPELGYGPWAVGYQESFGWVGGRDAYGQVMLAPGTKLRLLGRLSYFYTDGGQDSNVSGQSEVGSLLQADYRVGAHLAVHASLLTRLGLQGAMASGLNVPLGFVASGGLSGFF